MSGDDGGLVKKLIPLQKPDNGVPTEVDITSLEGAVPWLDSLKKYMADHLVQTLSHMKLSPTLASLYFSKVDSATQLSKKHNDHVDMLLASYRDVVHALTIASHATAAIAKNYRDAEHNNALNVAAVEKAFADESGGGSNTSTAGGYAT